MARTISSIRTELTRRKFPCGVLDDDDMLGIIDAALREFDRVSPLVVFASFETVADQQDYLVFDPADTVTQIEDPDNPGEFLALCANALAVREVYWNPGGDWSSLNLFSPGWQMLSQMVLFTGSYFHQPSQITILRQKLNAWKNNFGSQGFEVYGEPGDTDAFLRIFPVPKETGGKVIVEFERGHTLATIDRSFERHFNMWIEYFVCEAMANYYSQTSGIDLLGFETKDHALKYWSGRWEKWERKIKNIQFGPHGQVERS